MNVIFSIKKTLSFYTGRHRITALWATKFYIQSSENDLTASLIVMEVERREMEKGDRAACHMLGFYLPHYSLPLLWSNVILLNYH